MIQRLTATTKMGARILLVCGDDNGHCPLMIERKGKLAPLVAAKMRPRTELSFHRTARANVLQNAPSLLDMPWSAIISLPLNAAALSESKKTAKAPTSSTVLGKSALYSGAFEGVVDPYFSIQDQPF
ncbi:MULTISPECIES: hypothetical protein [unclassified Rhizobium]|uniref:hypothetical protein n=1 Tax=unclassified Rhizobium TaxID=2613769 RepID=UPI0016148054|nr:MULTISPECIES: hypothetical protein [unclassified Rhizobium]MBB3395024.1 hypothetical protein [Rhizobium sp. BK060]MBB4167395.1 hypothetical protein [Rhizobium sp. BK538]